MANRDKIFCGLTQTRSLAICDSGDLFNFLVGQAFDVFLKAWLSF